LSTRSNKSFLEILDGVTRGTVADDESSLKLPFLNRMTHIAGRRWRREYGDRTIGQDVSSPTYMILTNGVIKDHFSVEGMRKCIRYVRGSFKTTEDIITGLVEVLQSHHVLLHVLRIEVNNPKKSEDVTSYWSGRRPVPLDG
jgi:hypothetical protein